MSARRTYVVTGSASGMGAATRHLLVSAGARVIGVDLRDADVIADLATPGGRAAMVTAIERETDAVDGVIACAGLSGSDGADLDRVVRVNYFGAVATLEGLRPLLAASGNGRAVCVSSLSGVLGHCEVSWDDALVEACLDGDEEAAVAARGTNGPTAYASAKRALILWARRAATTQPWAAEPILLNIVAPGLVRTPMNDHHFATPERAAQTARFRPQPLGWGKPEQIASLLAWLAGPANSFVTGQVICADGGYEALVRPDFV